MGYHPRMEPIGESIWCQDSGKPGVSLAISFGVHGNERAPVDAGLRLVEEFGRGERTLREGKLLLLHANPRATERDERWSEGGMDLNRCFHPDVLAAEPELFEQRRARELVEALERVEAEVLVDFHCTVEPGSRFLMQHPPVDHAPSRRAYSLLQADTLLADPDLNFGGVSFDEWMSTRGKVGICYETGWIGDPANSPESVHGEMLNLMRGHGLLEGEATRYPEKTLLSLAGTIPCEEEGFAWCDGMGTNLQRVAAGSVLGTYASGREVVLDTDAVLIFPKKKPELVKIGSPLVYIGLSG